MKSSAKHVQLTSVDDLFTTEESRIDVLVPAIARLREKGGYELVAGHRRKRACELAGLETMPVIVRKLDDDEATIIMVDSNIQRESLLPSEKAFAYRMKLEAIDRVKGRPRNVGQVVPHYLGKRSTEVVAEGTGESYKQIQRYIRLTERVTLSNEKLRRYFPKSYTPQQMEQVILKLLEGWHRRQQQAHER